MILRLLLAVAALAAAFPAAAEPADIAAASRSVVRVVIVATEGEEAYFVGHGSGVAVAPDKIVTNAHVVQMLAEDSSLLLGVVPSQGAGSIGAKVIAYSPGQDLALLQLAEGARLPRAAIYSGPVEDGAQVVAIGYPGGVDRAQGLSLEDLIQPQTPVKTRGNISSGRSARAFDTLLHTAALGAGNSGGPLVDGCGRIVGINSFGTISDAGGDAEFFFAVSARELLSFLRKAGVQAQPVGTACRSLADIQAEEAARTAAARAEGAQQAARAAAERLEAEAREARQEELRLIAERENWLAGAGLLLALAVVAAGATMLFLQKDRQGPAKLAGGLALLLLAGAVIAFLARPALVGTGAAEDGGGAQAAGAGKPALSGALLCTVVPERSRITVSAADDLPFDWRADGCVNGRTQYAAIGGREEEARWSRIFVPNVDAEISDVSFVPATGEYRIDRYLADADTLAVARKARAAGTVSGCTADPARLARLAAMQAKVRAALPAAPNERIVYRCRAAANAG